MPRKRDAELDARIMESARAIAHESGLDALTIAAVAQRAEVSRPTVYRRWINRAALVFELQLSETIPEEFPDLGSFRTELLMSLTYLHRQLVAHDREIHAEQLGSMIVDRSFAEQVWERRWIPDRETVMGIWRRGVERGELDPDADGVGFIDDCAATTMFRVFFWHSTDEAWIEPFVDRMIEGVARR